MPADCQTSQSAGTSYFFLSDGTLGPPGSHQELFLREKGKGEGKGKGKEGKERGNRKGKTRQDSGTFPSKIKLYLKARSPARDREGQELHIISQCILSNEFPQQIPNASYVKSPLTPTWQL